MLFNLLLARKKYCYDSSFYLLFCLIIFFVIPIIKENKIVGLALTIAAETPITLANEIIDTSALVADKTIKVLSI